MIRYLPVSTIVPLVCTTLLPQLLSAQESENDEIVTLSEFQVNAQAFRDEYIASEAISGTRTGARILDLPFTVQVITEEFIQDFQLYESDQQFSFVSGYSPGATDAGNGPQGSRIRGFPPLVLVDGFSRVGVPDAMTTSQVEIIKGPQSTLYGRAQPGGMINYVTKRPKNNAQYDFQAILGTYNFERYTAEATGPIIKDKLYYFGGAVYSYNEGDMDFFYLRQNILAGGLTYKFNDKSSVTLKYEKQDRTQNRGTDTELRINTISVPPDELRHTAGKVTGIYLPLATFNQYGPNNRALRNTEKWSLLFEHRINEVWSFRLNSQYYDFMFDEVRRTAVQFIERTQRFNESAPFSSTTTEHGGAVQADLLARFQTGDIGHMVLFAADWTTETLKREDYQLPGREEIVAQPDSVRFLDPFNPDWQPIDRSLLTRRSNFYLRDLTYYGAFASHRGFFFNGRLISMAGIRYDVSDSDITAPVAGKGEHDSISYTTGLNYNVLNNDALVLFANRSTSFNPSVRVDEGTGEPQPNEESEGWEIGVKGMMWQDRLSLTLAAYELLRLNIPTSNPDFLSASDTPGIPQFLGSGVERAEGIDFDFSLRATDSLTLLGSFGYTDARIKEEPDNPHLVGDVLIRIPKTTSSLAVRYLVREGMLKGLRMGISGTYTGGVLINYESASRERTYRGSVTLFNAFIGYNWRSASRMSHSVQFNVLNLADEFYLDVGGRVGRGRELRLSYKLRF